MAIIIDPTDDESQEPDTGAVFDMTNGEKVRIEYCNVYLYRSIKNGSGTAVEIGWAPNTETIMLSMSFSDFDQLIQANKEAWDEYNESQGMNDYPC